MYTYDPKIYVLKNKKRDLMIGYPLVEGEKKGEFTKAYEINDFFL